MDAGDVFWLIMIGGPLLVGLILAIGLFSSVRSSKKNGVQIENIRAQLILPTTDYKAMETFLLNKEPYLTPELIKQLIDRINELKIDAQLIEQFDAKLRISAPIQDPLSYDADIIDRLQGEEKERNVS